MKYLTKTLPFFANQVIGRDRQPVDEHFIGINRLATHLFDLSYINESPVEIGIEQTQSLGWLLNILEPRCPRQK